MINSQNKTINKALIEAELIEIKKLEELPHVDFEFSKNHDQKISEIINNIQKKEQIVHKSKIAILIAAVILIFATLTACAFGKQIKGFFIKFDDFISSFQSNDNRDIPYVEYTFTYIPEGYEVYQTNRTPKSTEIAYTKENNYLIIYQTTAKQALINIDTNNGTYEIINIGDFEIHYVFNHNTHTLLWETDTHIFTISTYDYLPFDEIEKIVIGIQKPTE